jgi:hypothetical protein
MLFSPSFVVKYFLFSLLFLVPFWTILFWVLSSLSCHYILFPLPFSVSLFCLLASLQGKIITAVLSSLSFNRLWIPTASVKISFISSFIPSWSCQSLLKSFLQTWLNVTVCLKYAS